MSQFWIVMKTYAVSKQDIWYTCREIYAVWGLEKVDSASLLEITLLAVNPRGGGDVGVENLILPKN